MTWFACLVRIKSLWRFYGSDFVYFFSQSLSCAYSAPTANVWLFYSYRSLEIIFQESSITIFIPVKITIVWIPSTSLQMSELWQCRYCNICQSKMILMMCSIIYSKSNHHISFISVGLWNSNRLNKNSSSHLSTASLSQPAAKCNTSICSVPSLFSHGKKNWKNGSLVHWDKNSIIIEKIQNITIKIM